MLPMTSPGRMSHNGDVMIFKILLLQHSATVACICTKFDTETQNGVPEAGFLSKFTSDKIQDGGGRFFEIFLNGHNSVAIARIFTKFDGETENEAHKMF